MQIHETPGYGTYYFEVLAQIMVREMYRRCEPSQITLPHLYTERTNSPPDKKKQKRREEKNKAKSYAGTQKEQNKRNEK